MGGSVVSLDYQFAPIDVRIEGHPRAWVAGVEAMGLWLWGMVHARQHATLGRLSRAAVMGAWGGKRNGVLVERLVDSGLWVVCEGGWEIHNFELKAGGRSKSTDRVKRHRDRVKRESVVSVTAAETVSGVSVTRSNETFGSMSMSVSASESDPDLASEPPSWFPTALAVIEMNVGEKLDAGEAWLRYRGHRSKKRESISQHDAEYWLTTVMVKENRAAREEAHRRTERDVARDAGFKAERAALLPKAPKAENSTKLFKEREQWARDAGAPDPEAQARLNKLLGKVGSS